MASPDKRITRSKKLIRDSFFELMLEKPADRITVVDICGRAGVNRCTFYAHYADINALRSELERALADEVLDAVEQYKDAGEPKAALLAVLRLIKRKRGLYSLWFDRPSVNESRISINDIFFEMAAPLWEAERELDEWQLQTLLRFILAGVYSVVRDWYRGGFAEDENALADFLENTVKYGTHYYVRKGDCADKGRRSV